MSAFKDLTGKRYGRLTVERLIGKIIVSGTSHALWQCKCDCGEITTAKTCTLNIGEKKSCGCLQKEHAAKTAKDRATHGLRNHRLYPVWKAMLQRCESANCKGYENYGGRGISVCERWHDVRLFIEDMWGSYKEGLAIDRINNDGNYCPENCAWRTPKENNNNKRQYKNHRA